MSRLFRILTAPFRFLFWLNYGDLGAYRSSKAGDMNRVAHRKLTPAELGRSERQTQDIADGMSRYGGMGPGTG